VGGGGAACDCGAAAAATSTNARLGMRRVNTRAMRRVVGVLPSIVPCDGNRSEIRARVCVHGDR
jgi:hypothetical protein